jgi:hypothetical protein
MESLDPSSPDAARGSARRAPCEHRSETGSVLVEVVWSAMILAIVVGAVLMSMDNAAISSGVVRSHATAATLAEQDQERLRSFRAVDLSNYTEERTVNLGGGPYTVTSLVEWLRDSNGEPLSCTNGSVQADYMLLGSTATSGLLRGRSVHFESLLAPPVGSFGPTQGTLGVQVVDRSGVALQDVDVAISGPDAATLPTNELGCAIFGYVPPGSYTASLDEAGWVDVSGIGAVSRSATVSGGNVNAITIQYDRAATMTMSFQTVVGGGAAQSSAARTVTLANSGVPPSGARSFSSVSRVSSFNTTTLFPFTSGYVVYAGDCASANPQSYDAAYFAARPGFVQTSPGGTYGVVVRVPAINVAVTRAGSALPNAKVIITPTGASCGEKNITTTNSAGALSDPGMPFGSYTVCADDGVRRKLFAGTVQNTDPAGTSTIALSIPTSGTTGLCP